LREGLAVYLALSIVPDVDVGPNLKGLDVDRIDGNDVLEFLGMVKSPPRATVWRSAVSA